LNSLNKPNRPVHIMLAIMPQSPFNKSIWTGFLHGFQALGHTVQVVDANLVPAPEDSDADVDLLFVVHGLDLPSERVRAWRARGVTTAVYLLDEPYEVDRTTGWARHYDFVFSVDRITVPVHQQCTQARFLPLAYNASIFNPDGPRVPSRILVLGTPFGAREKYLAELRDKWGDLTTWVGPGWKQFSPAGVHHDRFVTPPECAALYRGADIVINIHRDSHWSHFGELNKSGLEATHLNPRFWEAAACRTLQLCSYRRDLDKFAPQCPSFKTVDEFTKKLEYFVNNEKARQDKAARVYNKIKHHTYQSSCIAVLKEAGFNPVPSG